jgi:hypothetical protein
MTIARSGRSLVIAAAFVGAVTGRSRAQSAQAPYPSMAPVAAYSIPDRAAEVALARSAAPDSISRHATILVLGPHGYERAVEGTNGFVCVVERSWMSPFDSPQFWNPKMRGPTCFNPAAARSILPITLRRTELVLSGSPQPPTVDGIRAALASSTFPPLEQGAMSYMMSKDGFLNDRAGHWVPHLMFYAAASDSGAWGADVVGSPVMLNPQFLGAPERISVFMVPLRRWSDGSPAPALPGQ